MLAYALDRVIRSLIDYVNVTEQLKALDVDLVTVDGTLGEIGEGGDPYREAMAGFLAVFAELERKVIVRRTRDGIKNAQAKGVKLRAPAPGDRLGGVGGAAGRASQRCQTRSKALGRPSGNASRLLNERRTEKGDAVRRV